MTVLPVRSTRVPREGRETSPLRPTCEIRLPVTRRAEFSITPASPVIKRAPSNKVCARAGVTIVTTVNAATTTKKDNLLRWDMKFNLGGETLTHSSGNENRRPPCSPLLAEAVNESISPRSGDRISGLFGSFFRRTPRPPFPSGLFQPRTTRQIRARHRIRTLDIFCRALIEHG